jgi:hypothetical protein
MEKRVRDLIMTKRYYKRAVLLFVLLFVAAFFPTRAFAQNNAVAAIDAAKGLLATCYNSAKQAENAGANISSLTSVLNQAGGLLSQSEFAYFEGDFEVAENYASECSQRLTSFVSEADGLRDAAVQQQRFNFWVNFVCSSVGTLLVILTGVVVWLLIKKRNLHVRARSKVKSDEPSGV